MIQNVHDQILDGALLVAEGKREIVGAAGICLDSSELVGLFIDDKIRSGSVPEKLIARVEQMAIGFGILELKATISVQDKELFESLGYETLTDQQAEEKLVMKRSLRRRQTQYSRRIHGLMESLKIQKNYARRHRLSMQPEARRLKSIGLDVFGREQQLSPGAANAWKRLLINAAKNNVEIQVVSAWRSVDYQLGLVQNKIDKGQKIEDILKVSAVPGYSEHHTGLALDVTAPGFAVLEEEFENSPAFSWLLNQAEKFKFRLSFPRGNRHQIAYEPWHWFYYG